MGQLILKNAGLESIKKIGCLLGKYIEPKDIIIFFGPLGAGKTTLIKEICTSLKTTEPATSPSFTIINKYNGKFNVIHMDLYRLNSQEEVDSLDLEKIFSEINIVLIEWADSFMQLLPKYHLEIVFNIKNHSRRNLTFKAFGSKYNNLLKDIKNEHIST